jgi:hypothetical protein
MDDEELYIPDDILEETSAARYLKNQNYVITYQKELEKFTSE